MAKKKTRQFAFTALDPKVRQRIAEHVRGELLNGSPSTTTVRNLIEGLTHQLDVEGFDDPKQERKVETFRAVLETLPPDLTYGEIAEA